MKVRTYGSALGKNSEYTDVESVTVGAVDTGVYLALNFKSDKLLAIMPPDLFGSPPLLATVRTIDVSHMTRSEATRLRDALDKVLSETPAGVLKETEIKVGA